jgi:hypothetical protein
MKKYRCLWGKSTANHNIWYFLRTSSTSLQNLLPTHKTRAILLWKAQTALSGAVLGHTQLPKIQCNQCPQRYALQPNKPMPLKKSEQEAKQVQIWRCPVGVVDNWVPIIDRDCPTPFKVDSAAVSSLRCVGPFTATAIEWGVPRNHAAIVNAPVQNSFDARTPPYFVQRKRRPFPGDVSSIKDRNQLLDFESILIP